VVLAGGLVIQNDDEKKNKLVLFRVIIKNNVPIGR